MEELKKLVSLDSIAIHGNKNPIRMDIFLSFLQVPVEENKNCLGHDNLWTEHFNSDIHLVICGGIIGGVEYLHSIKYGKNLHRPYNNFVNPLYIWDLLSIDGKRFFVDYHAEEIREKLDSKLEDLKFFERKFKEKQNTYLVLENAFLKIKTEVNNV